MEQQTLTVNSTKKHIDKKPNKGASKNAFHTSQIAPVNGRLAYKIHEAASLMGVHTNSIRRLIKTGQLKACGRLRHILIPHQEIMKFLTPMEAA